MRIKTKLNNIELQNNQTTLGKGDNNKNTNVLIVFDFSFSLLLSAYMLPSMFGWGCNQKSTRTA